MEKYMSFKDCLDVIVSLSHSQGFYGRLLNTLEELEWEKLEDLRKLFEEKKFENEVDFILWIEGGE